MDICDGQRVDLYHVKFPRDPIVMKCLGKNVDFIPRVLRHSDYRYQYMACLRLNGSRPGSLPTTHSKRLYITMATSPSSQTPPVPDGTPSPSCVRLSQPPCNATSRGGSTSSSRLAFSAVSLFWCVFSLSLLPANRTDVRVSLDIFPSGPHRYHHYDRCASKPSCAIAVTKATDDAILFS